MPPEWRGDLSNTLSVVAGACGAGVAIVCTMVMTGAGLVRGLGQAAVRVVATVFSLVVLGAFMLALTLPLQLLVRYAFMEAYQRRYPDASQYMFEQIITLTGLAVIGLLVRRRWGASALVMFMLALSAGIPLVAGV